MIDIRNFVTGEMEMFTMKRIASFLNYKKELVVFLGFVVTFFVGLSLYSYKLTDPSLFYATSAPQPIGNACGLVGAYIAGLLFFLLGSSAYFLIPLGFIVSYWISTDIQWREEWERIIAGVGLLVAIAAIYSLHRIAIVPGIVAGGYIGYTVMTFVYYFFDYIGSIVFLYTSVIVCFIILFRFSFIYWVQQLCVLGVRCYALLVYYRVFPRVYNGALKLAWLLTRPFVLLVQFSMHLLDGSAFEDTGLLEQENDSNTLPVLVQKKIESAHYKQTTQADNKSINDHNNSHADATDDEEILSYGLPSLDIFIGVKERREDKEYRQALEERARILEEKLERFGVCGTIVSIKNGPVVTLFEYQPNIDTKLSKILALEDDLALALQALSIRILAPIPGRSVVGFEVANRDRKDVLLSQVVQSLEYDQFGGSLPLILGKNTIGNNVVVDLVKMPHLLIAGSTGSGKSVALNAMLISLLCKCTPDELKLILIDPKRLEFAPYADIAHLLFPIVTDPKKAVPILRWIVHQMEERYEKMAQYGARNIFDYNALASSNEDEPFSFIVVVIDELSDLMLTVGREIEDVILRITQMARAAGIHMIVATQRPSVDVITGLIKVNFPSRISFRVTSRVDSRTILDCGGADKLLGRGDMLFLDSTASILKRIHGAYVSDHEINQVVSHIKSQKCVEYLDVNEQLSAQNSEISPEDEELYEQVISYLDEVEEVSISLLQRKFRIGYNRSARIISMLEGRGLIMPADGGKARRVIRG